MSNNYKAQYKSSPGGQWQTKLSGGEHGCMASYQTLKQNYEFARVIDPNGRVVT